MIFQAQLVQFVIITARQRHFKLREEGHFTFASTKRLSVVHQLLPPWLPLPLDLSLRPLIKAELWLPRATANYRITRPDSAVGIQWVWKVGVFLLILQ